MNLLSFFLSAALIGFALIAPCPAYAQSNTLSDIFADLTEFKPAPAAAPAPEAAPPKTIPTPASAQKLPPENLPEAAVSAPEQTPPAKPVAPPDKKEQRNVNGYKATRNEMLKNVQAAWDTSTVEGEAPGDAAESGEPSGSETQANAVRSKLEAIRIPSLSFQDAGIQQAVSELSKRCRELDPEHKGINLVVLGTADTLLPPVTFSGTDLSALEALNIITQIAGMKIEIGSTAVTLTPVNYEPPQQMVATEFDLIPAVGSKLAARANGQTGGLIDVRDFFSTVPFPPGSSAQYNPEFNVLLVRNVPKYIEKVSALLNRYNRKAVEECSRQVEIETKFIEVSQGALDELGFEWTLGSAGSPVNNDTWAVAGGQKLFTDTLRDGQTAFSTGVNPAGRASSFNSYAGTLADPTGTGLVGAAGELLVQKVKGTPIDLVIRALERTAGSDLLSAPKILAKSGETARIHVGEVHWFPTAFDVSIERYAQPSLIPLDYAEERTGVMLEVTPGFDPETGTINMKLAPEIRELAGFDEQHVGTIWPEYGDESLNMDAASGGSGLLDFLTAREESRTVNADRLIARRPVFKTRKVETSVTIEDGSTIAMGGLIKEQLETFKDSVPFLGRIPLLGRFFRSEGERSVKRNLLIFVTANQVNTSGYKKSAQ
ncbi:MAG: hypothetical protein MUC65_01645 [Pontiellaceae bacterium]|jgi:general secretion pathway protein D|nr:hypothetical protein [Pontiellaceae bacterium]